MSYFRSGLFSVLYFCTGMFFGSLSVLLLVLPIRLRHKIIMSWTFMAVQMLRFICGVKYELIGREHLQNRQGPVVILAKHQSTWETLYLQNLFWPASTVLKKELLNIPFFGWGLRALVPIAIDRENPREALREVKVKGLKRLKHDYNLLLFPEGTRMKVGERGKYARSGADIAVESGVSIIPVAHNAGKFWPSGEFLKKPGTIKIVLGEPISPEGKTSKMLIQQVEDWIETTVKTL
ncbi:lysophospholipid acyltransferase family protein [Teredinibacter turnerae]|uniref:lysophospholipid acyltransferase family protein n=1 Tax=Teredinibacter turnerae TaxID=2426 RepID=UPI00035E1529|nr:lysophospholipid acyltransferase family protein [Teredinibacter turnerae]